MSRRQRDTFVPGLVQLESREVPAVASVRLAGDLLIVQANNSPTTALVVQNGSNIVVKDAATGRNWSFKTSEVSRVDVFGGRANDNLTARTTSVLVRVNGGNGNDTINGGSNRDILNGGNGNDTIRGNGGNDTIGGGAGDDILFGGDGNDTISGDTGDDHLDGGVGADGLDAGSGEDVVVSLDEDTADVIDGGAGVDTFWTDQNGTATDRLVASSGDAVHAISGFTNAGTDRTINADRIPDPLPLPGDRLEVMNNKPLFSSDGPGYEDLSQGQLGDCWMLCGLGTIANSYPEVIRQHIVDFRDGTYGVKLGDEFFRVDNDLPVAHVGNTWLQYTAFGRQGSIWVAIMEKAYTHYRAANQPTYGNSNPLNTYGSIEGGFTFDAFEAFGLTASRLWFGTAAPSAGYGLNTTAQQLSNTIRMIVDNGLAGSVGFQTVPAGAPLISAHQYILLDYTVDPTTGLVADVILRNPWGVDGPGTSPGPGNDNNFDDGIVTINVTYVDTAGNQQPGLLMNCWASLEWGTA